MKKNYFLKTIQTLLVFSLAFTLTNCGNLDNPLEELSGSGGSGSAPAATITTAPVATTGDITAGETTEIVSAAATTEGTIMYKVTTENTKPTSTEGFSETLPTAQELPTGIFYVWYYAKGDAAHTDSEIFGPVKATVNVANLATATVNMTVPDGGRIYGTLASNVKISIAADATVTLDGANINASGTWTTGDYAGITCEGDATIILKAGTTNTVKGFAANFPGIQAGPSGSTLIIQGTTGTLNVSSNGQGAGIGCSGWGAPCGNIEIQGGNITANGGSYAAGIGSAACATCGNITISGGTVEAAGPTTGDGTGIGTGTGNDINGASTCGNISITGGDITAYGGNNGAGIGSNYAGNCGTITISGGNVSAIKGATSPNSIGYGHGDSGTLASTCGTVTIGGTIYWDGTSYQNGGGDALTGLPHSPYIYPAP